MHYLKQVAQTPIICQRIHQLHSKMPSKVVVSWVPGHTSIAGNERADFLSHNCPAPSSPAQLPSDPWATRMAAKEDLRRRTRALIPPCSVLLPLNLTRMEEVVLRRIRLGVALTPARTSGWKGDYRGHVKCPTCCEETVPADLHHLLWTCPGTKDIRRKCLMAAGLNLQQDTHYHRWLHGPAYRSLLDYIREANLVSWI